MAKRGPKPKTQEPNVIVDAPTVPLGVTTINDHEERIRKLEDDVAALKVVKSE